MEVLVSTGGQVVVIENVHKGEALFKPYSDSSGNQSLRRVGFLGSVSPMTIHPWETSLPRLQRCDSSTGHQGLRGVVGILFL